MGEKIVSIAGYKVKVSEQDPSTLWTEDLTGAQLLMVMESGPDELGVELTGAGKWATARALEAKGLGKTQDGHPNGSNLPGLYFNNAEGARISQEHAEDDDDADDRDEEGFWPWS